MADDLPAVLAEYRDRNEWRIEYHRYTPYTVEHDVPEGDVRRLLAALDKVAALAAGARTAMSAPPPDCTNVCDRGECNCSGIGRPLAWDLDPAALLEAITRELTGKGKADV
jgi:hypothetical protein